MIKPALLALAVLAIAPPALASSHYWNTYANGFEQACSQQHQNNYANYCYCINNYYNTVFDNSCNNYGCGEDYPHDERDARARGALNALDSVNNHIQSQGCK